MCVYVWEWALHPTPIGNQLYKMKILWLLVDSIVIGCVYVFSVDSLLCGLISQYPIHIGIYSCDCTSTNVRKRLVETTSLSHIASGIATGKVTKYNIKWILFGREHKREKERERKRKRVMACKWDRVKGTQFQSNSTQANETRRAVTSTRVAAFQTNLFKQFMLNWYLCYVQFILCASFNGVFVDFCFCCYLWLNRILFVLNIESKPCSCICFQNSGFEKATIFEKKNYALKDLKK